MEQVYRHLRDLRDHLMAQTGRPAEISDGEIVMMMSPVPMHGLTAKRIVRQLDAQLPRPWPRSRTPIPTRSAWQASYS